MRLTEEQLFDYIYCPTMYAIKHKNGFILPKRNSIKQILINCSNYFYNYVLNKQTTPTFKLMTNKYESLFEDIQNETSSTTYNEGLLLLNNFFNWACDNRIAVIDSNTKYVINFDGNILEGVMNPIAINSNKALEFLILDFSNKNIDQFLLDSKLKYTIDFYAFNSSFSNRQIEGIKLHKVKTNKDFITTRNEHDYKRLKTIVNNVVNGIENEIYFPRETYLCNSCQYRHYCKGWEGI